MRPLLKWMFIISFVMMASVALAGERVDAPGMTNPPKVNPTPALDDQCYLTFIGNTFGTWSGSMSWPGGSGPYYLSGYMFTNTCAPGETLFTYCTDLDHPLQHQTYCADIYRAAVRASYPEQYPAMAYALTWYPVVTGTDDQIMQLTVWKLSNDERISSPTHSQPWYHIDGGRGYPDPLDTPSYPYVNTVYNTNTGINDPANTRVLNAIGQTDGIPKNVVLSGDALAAANGSSVIGGGLAVVPVTVTLTRGALAASLNNASLSGVKLVLSTDIGTLSATEGFTDAFGEIHVTLTVPVSAPGATIRVCTYGVWPQEIVPCVGWEGQQLLVQSRSHGYLDSVCTTLFVDEWLPVELASFQAAGTVDGINLTWRTASETNADRWEIERRASNNADFQRIASLDAVNSAQGASYSYSDVTAESGRLYEYRLADVSLSGERTVHSSLIRSASRPEGGESHPTAYALDDNYPNPFNPSTRIRFSLPEASMVSLKVYDVLGHEVASLVSGRVEAGSHDVNFRASGLPSGIYFYTLNTSSYSQTKKMILMK